MSVYPAIGISTLLVQWISIKFGIVSPYTGTLYTLIQDISLSISG
jgi:hypothetical protein